MLDLSNRFSTLGSWVDTVPNYEELLRGIESNVIAKTPRVENIFPKPELIFSAFAKASYVDLSVVVIGQDPYHQRPIVGGEEVQQATGLSFSVPLGVKPPPSLVNIYKELDGSIQEWSTPPHGCLDEWASDVLLLNSTLTVEHSKAGSHAKTGWLKFTDCIIQALKQRKKPIVFLAWGRHAHQLVSCVEGTHHCVIKTSHPSPLGATKSGSDFVPFLGSNCFNLANDFLRSQGLREVDWNLTKNYGGE